MVSNTLNAFFKTKCLFQNNWLRAFELHDSCGCCSLNSFSLQVRQKSHLFAFGAAVNSNLLLRKPEYRDFYLKNFQWAVLESALKWRVIEPTPVSYEISIYFRSVWLYCLFLSNVLSNALGKISAGGLGTISKNNPTGFILGTRPIWRN